MFSHNGLNGPDTDISVYRVGICDAVNYSPWLARWRR